MKFVERLKTDKSYRWKVILIFTAIVLVIGNYQGSLKKEAPSQDTCDQFNSFALTTSTTTCVNAGCAVTAPDYKLGLDFVECAQAGLENLGLYCNNNPGSNPVKTFLAEDLNQANDLCGVGKKAIDAGTKFCFKTLYTCTDVPASEQCENELQDTLSGFLDSADFASDFTCKQKYYLISFGGGFAALMVLLAVI